MSRIARILVPTLGAVLATGVLGASPATAKGGDSTSPAPVVANYCPADPNLWTVVLSDGSTVFANEASGAGCVFVRSYPAGFLRLDSVTLAPGWSYIVQKNGEGTSSRVELQFTESATGRKVGFRVEFGKTRIG